jgi:hypothetical protein
MGFGFKFLDRVYHHLGQPSEREFAARLGTYLQRLQGWRRSNDRVRDIFKILSRARSLSGKSWAQFGKEFDEEFGPEK